MVINVYALFVFSQKKYIIFHVSHVKHISQLPILQTRDPMSNLQRVSIFWQLCAEAMSTQHKVKWWCGSYQGNLKSHTGNFCAWHKFGVTHSSWRHLIKFFLYIKIFPNLESRSGHLHRLQLCHTSVLWVRLACAVSFSCSHSSQSLLGLSVPLSKAATGP